MPFDSTGRAPLAPALLCDYVKAYGYDATCFYPSLDFAALIGEQTYSRLGEFGETTLLLGDAVFAEAALGTPVDWQALIHRGVKDRDELIKDLARLSAVAALWIKELAMANEWRNWSLVGCSATFQVLPSLALFKALKNTHGDAAPKMVIGGALCEGIPGDHLFAASPYIDYLVKGEGERPLVYLLNAISGKQRLLSHPGLFWRDRNGTAWRPQVSRADKLPLEEQCFPKFKDWADARRVAGLPVLDYWYPIQTSRGCWFGEHSHCTFCGLNGEDMEYRARDATSVKHALDAYAKEGLHKFFAVDNIFPQKYFKELLPLLSISVQKTQLFYEVKANITRAQIKALVSAGVVVVQPGIESLSTQVLRKIRKGTSAVINIRLLRDATEFGLRLNWNMLYGVPGESAADYLSQLSLIPKLRHLQPPLSGGSRIRLDRFSPLFFDAQNLGVQNIRPVSAYAQVYSGFLPELIAQYFDFDADFEVDPSEYYEPVSDAISAWRKSYSSALLFILRIGDTVSVYDSRGQAPHLEYDLPVSALKMLKKCEEGASSSSLAVAFGSAWFELARTLLSHDLLIEVDDRFLCLAFLIEHPDIDAIPGLLRVPAVTMMLSRAKATDYANGVL